MEPNPFTIMSRAKFQQETRNTVACIYPDLIVHPFFETILSEYVSSLSDEEINDGPGAAAIATIATSLNMLSNAVAREIRNGVKNADGLVYINFRGETHCLTKFAPFLVDPDNN
jgi:hypothetical protein